MLVTVAILVLVTAALSFFQSAGIRMYSRGRQQADLESSLRYALALTTRDLRPALDVSAPLQGSRISYTDAEGRKAAFYLDTSRQELRQTVTGATPPDTVVAEGVERATFTVLPGPSPLVLISLTGRRGDRTESVSAAVAVRAP
ncbi:MAG: hypothetical protein ACYC5Y_00890 [Symbiobacteriia bacterium]